MSTCRCCGQEIKSDVESLIVAMGVNNGEAEILRILDRHRGMWVMSFRIADALYADSIDGGPENADIRISRNVARMRKILDRIESPFMIESRRTYGGGYRLVRGVASK
jgi:hypothetical protein